MWRQHLVSKRVRHPNGHVDEFHVLTSEQPDDYQYTECVQARPGITIERTVAFIIDCGNQIYIGVDSRVKDIFDEDYPYAYELLLSNDGSVKKNRPITFVHGYFASKDYVKQAGIPALDELFAWQKQHLGEILQRANNGEEHVVVNPVSFTTKRVIRTDTEWDRFAIEFQKGSRKDQGATFTINGNFFRSLDTPRKETPIEEIDGTSGNTKKKTSVAPSISRQHFIKNIMVTLGVTITGIAVWELITYLIDRWKNKKDERVNEK